MLLKIGMNFNSFMFNDLLSIKDKFYGDKQSEWY